MVRFHSGRKKAIMLKHSYFTMRTDFKTPRRIIILLLVFIPATAAGGYVSYMLPHRGTGFLEPFILFLFTVLFAWISIGFWTALIGFAICLYRSIGHQPDDGSSAGPDPPGREISRTAVLMPICNEEVTRVFAGIKTVYESVLQTGMLKYFDFFILSDSSDTDTWIEEELAWAGLVNHFDASGKIFYRHRKINLHRKSGNIADFCRRWGQSAHCP